MSKRGTNGRRTRKDAKISDQQMLEMAQSSCACGKYKYLKKALAQKSIAGMRAYGSGAPVKGRALIVYKCPTDRRCWHIGHQNPNLRGQTREEQRSHLVGKLRQNSLPSALPEIELTGPDSTC